MRVLAEIPVDGAGHPRRLSGVRMRCAVPSNVERVAGCCVGAGNFVQALVWFIVNAKVAEYVAAAVRVRAAAPGIYFVIFFPASAVVCVV